jgi:hypothetical protein
LRTGLDVDLDVLPAVAGGDAVGTEAEDSLKVGHDWSVTKKMDNFIPVVGAFLVGVAFGVWIISQMGEVGYLNQQALRKWAVRSDWRDDCKAKRP